FADRGRGPDAEVAGDALLLRGLRLLLARPLVRAARRVPPEGDPRHRDGRARRTLAERRAARVRGDRAGARPARPRRARAVAARALATARGLPRRTLPAQATARRPRRPRGAALGRRGLTAKAVSRRRAPSPAIRPRR